MEGERYQELMEVENALKEELAIKREFSCDTESWKTSNDHIPPFKKPFSCFMCGKIFTTLSHLKTHETVHTREKPYSCSQYDYKCSTSSHLKTHERIHTGDEPFICSKCGNKFRHVNALGRHERIHR